MLKVHSNSDVDKMSTLQYHFKLPKLIAVAHHNQCNISREVLKQIKAGDAIAKEKGSKTNACKSLMIEMPCNKNHTKGSVSNSTINGKPGGGKVAQKH